MANSGNTLLYGYCFNLNKHTHIHSKYGKELRDYLIYKRLGFSCLVLKDFTEHYCKRSVLKNELINSNVGTT